MLLFKKIPKGIKIQKNMLREINPGTNIAIYIFIVVLTMSRNFNVCLQKLFYMSIYFVLSSIKLTKSMKIKK